MVKRIDFDDYAEEYESLLKSQLGFFNKDRDYFSWYKVSLVSYLIGNQPDSILDYGCGIGLSLPFLEKSFPPQVSTPVTFQARALKYAGKNILMRKYLWTMSSVIIVMI